MPLQKTEAIILRRRPFGDASLILSCYTKDYGKLNFLAKEIKKGLSRGRGGVEIFSLLELVYYEKASRALRVINHYTLINPFFPLRQDLIKFAYGSYYVELIDKLVHGEEKNEQIYYLLVNTLGFLEKEKDIKKLTHFFEIKLIGLLGYGFNLKSCLQCQHKKLAWPVFFSPSRGGVICSRCHAGEKDGLILHKISLWQFLEKADFQTLSRLKISTQDEEELKTILHRYLETLLEPITLRTLKVIEALEKK